MQLRFLKFLLPFVLYIGSIQSFNAHGWVIWLPLIFAWFMIPVLEIFIKPDPANLDTTEEELAKKNKAYDILLYVVIAAQYFALYEFLTSMKIDSLAWHEII